MKSSSQAATAKPRDEEAAKPAMQPEVIVSARELGKVYRLYERPWHRLFQALIGGHRHREQVAVTGVSFELRRGEGLGIVGQNGAGKSTLLKMLAGVVSPSSGEIEVKGQVSSILELGSGFHPEFTGRQNIRINAAMLGLDERAVEERQPAIEDFCELGHFLDQPVKVYSTGMAMRLAFAIATQVDPDVLIVDEALSVGDGYFQKKCTDRILELVGEGTTLLFCSHALYYISSFCGRVLWLKDGEVAALGPARDVIREYEDFLQKRRGSASVAELPADGSESESKPARLDAVSIETPRERRRGGLAGLLADGTEIDREPVLVREGEPLTLRVRWRSNDPRLRFQVGIGVNRSDGLEVFTLNSARLTDVPATGKAHYAGAFHIDALPLVKGDYSLYLFLLDERALHVYDQDVWHGAFRVEGDQYEFGLVRVQHRWALETDAESMAATVSAESGRPIAQADRS